MWTDEYEKHYNNKFKIKKENIENIILKVFIKSMKRMIKKII